MNITVLELSDDKVKISIVGQGHTFMNALISEIQKEPSVDVANYIIEFQFSDPILTVTTHDKKDPVAPVLAACTRLSSSCQGLLNDLSTVKQ
ncbi:MAG: DNA-directed RNA polymerase subunit L [Methanobacteriota archaeon]